MQARVKVNVRDPYGRVALHYAAMMGHAPMLRTLLASGAKASMRDHQGRIPLHLAVSPLETACAKQLLTTPVKDHINIKDTEGAVWSERLGSLSAWSR